MFRCLDCGTWFCRHCMEEHIGRTSHKNREIIECWDSLNEEEIKEKAADKSGKWVERLKRSGWEVG